MFDVIIVGAGTAGLSAAIYAVRAGKTALVLERKTYGGQIVNSPEVENYPGIPKISGFEFATSLCNQAKNLGAEVLYEGVVDIKRDEAGVFKITTENNEYECKAVVLATGAKNRPLGVAGEEALIGAGISYCATCDGMFFRGRDVAVVGGGNTALEDALFLSNYCNKVYLIHRRDAFRGEEKQVAKIRERDNVELVLSAKVVELKHDDVITGVVVESTKDGSVKELNVQGVFVAIGQMPDNQAFAKLVDLDDKGYIIAGENCRTDCEGVFVAGDCRTKKVRQLATAAADGAVAALAACEYIDAQ